MPKEQITPSASEVTGLKLNNGALYHNERKVNAISISSALESFLSFIEKQACVILVGHNIKSFDVHVLFHALDSCSLLDRMAHCVQVWIPNIYSNLSILTCAHIGNNIYQMCCFNVPTMHMML